MRFEDDLILEQNHLVAAAFEALASAPSTPVSGQVYFDSTTNKIGYWNGTIWVYPTGGGVTNFTAGNLSPLFTTSVATSTTTPALTFTINNQNANKVFSGPTTGGAAAPTFRSLVAADLPALDSTLITDFSSAVHTIVDPLIQGLAQKPTARVATAAALPANTYNNGTAGVGATITETANGALTVDGIAVAANDIVLVRNEATASHNGLYVVTQPGDAGTPFILTRHADMDQSAEFNGAFIPVDNEGTANANTLWLCNNVEAGIVVGTTSITFVQLNSATSYTAGTGINISGNVISISTGYTGQTSIVTLGTIVTGTWNGTTIAIANGGTGATTAAAARTNLGAVGKYSALIGDGATTAIAIAQGTHGLASNGQMWAACYDATTGELVQPDITINNSNGTVTFTFAVAPASNAYRIVIMG